ncbi:MAG: tetratricopeptide repeat protein [Elusimicrobia bacterium]|nr:tetratricopeptide repeat protein [Elusimicrobiota bacterium]
MSWKGAAIRFAAAALLSAVALHPWRLPHVEAQADEDSAPETTVPATEAPISTQPASGQIPQTPAASGSARSQMAPGSTKEKEILARYEKAFLYYKGGDYGPAVQIWNEILRMDPSQKTAQKMIEEARIRITEKSRTHLNKYSRNIAEGKYQKAFLDLQPLLDLDPTNPKYQLLQTRLEGILRVLPEASPATKAFKMAVRGLEGYVGETENLKLTYNGLRYAKELAPQEPKIESLMELFRSRHPEITQQADAVTPGMRFLEYKRFVALNQIYDGKYDMAIETLNEVLALEPKDLISLKRLGSSYYAIGHVSRARQIWSEALKLAPKDKQLKKFLAKSRNQKDRRSTAKQSKKRAAPR